MTKEIPLTQGKVALVDDEDFDYLNQWKWHYLPRGYAARSEYGIFHGIKRQINIRMHRQILNYNGGLVIDHINGNGIDNRRSNLRICTQEQNTRNRRPNKGCNLKGVKKYYHKWISKAGIDGKEVFIGSFPTEDEAVRAYNEFVTRSHGEFAYVNKILGED